MRYRNSQDTVRYQISDLIDQGVNVLVLAEFREPIRHAIPEIIDLLWDKELNIRRAGADALSKLLEHGKVSTFF